MIKILYIHGEFINEDGRSLSIISRLKKVFDVSVISRYGYQESYNYSSYIKTKNISYFKFFIFLFFLSFKFDFFFIDNRKAAFLSLPILFYKKKIIYDMRELYLLKDKRSIISNIGTITERCTVKKAKVLIIPNSYRSKIIKKILSINIEPLIFENRRQLKIPIFNNLNNEEVEHHCYIFNKKIKFTGSFTFISTSKFSFERDDHKILFSAKKFHNLQFIFVGNVSNRDTLELKKLLINLNLKNVYFIKRLPLNSLLDLIMLCNIGVVNYSKSNLNNKYCASGKIYEFLDCGLPILSSDNLPLKKIINTQDYGIASNNFDYAIYELFSKYSFYKSNVEKYFNSLTISRYEKNFGKKIINKLNNC